MLSQNMRPPLKLLLTLALAAAVANAHAVPESFPKFEFPSPDGVTRSSESLSGKVVVLNFWFTTCAPCIQEISTLNKVAEEFEDRGVVFVAPTFEPASTISAFLSKRPFRYNVVMFGEQRPERYFPNGKITFPMHVVIDRQGHVVYRAFSEAKPEDLRAAIASAL